jgi:hypothetical protein
MFKINWKAVLAWVKKLAQIFKKGGGKMGNTKLVLISTLLVFGLVMPLVMAENPITLPSELSAKQGMLLTYSDQHLQHSTTFEAAYTKPGENWPKWVNAAWSGWTTDLGFAYDASSADNAVIGLSRTVGTLADYLPIEFPILKKFKASITPVVLEIRHFTTDPELDGAFGFSYFDVTLKY